MLGYSCAHDNYAFNFTTSPAARKIVADFIANNVTVSVQMPVIHTVIHLLMSADRQGKCGTHGMTARVSLLV